MDPRFEHWIDGPRGEVTTPYVLIAGWVATEDDARVSDLHLRSRGERMELDPVERSDVVRKLSSPRPDGRAWRKPRARTPSVHACGFQRLLTLSEGAALEDARLQFDINGDPSTIPLSFVVPADAASKFAESKARKAERITSILQCPSCRVALHDDSSGLTCASCGHTYSRAGGVFDLLPSDLRNQHSITDTTSISAWGYDAKASQIIERFANGLVLDCGSGLRPSYLPNVVNLEIVNYPTTDVLGVGQALPFVDDSFDAVLSFAVLEHVSDPFACARELVRVLKPGGILLAVVPFLQPVHGYTEHYYNMTSRGLENLFADRLEITELGVPDQGHPIFSLRWILNSYMSGLSPEVATAFEELTVKDLLDDALSSTRPDIVHGLSEAATTELATTNFVLGIKP